MSGNEFIERRLSRLEDGQSRHEQLLAGLAGKMDAMMDTLGSVQGSIDRVGSLSNQPSAFHKGMLGFFVIQSILSGAMTAEGAKDILGLIFKGAAPP